ncbi:PilZ domain-containing protein [Acidobacteria bacterium AH-259-L09]|nr:PilZ domain-containing protein [Acidobacteria bacterium AH-259-L09]
MVSQVKREERRRFKRWEILIPCTVEWQGSSTTGQITNLSFGGALIKQANAAPPKGTPVIVTFQVKKEPVELEGRLAGRIVHTFRQFTERGDIICFGVQFEEPVEEVRSKLIPVFQTFVGEVD